MYCPHCGTLNPDDAEICSNCQKSLDLQTEQHSHKKKKKKKKSPLKIILIVLIAFVALIFLIGVFGDSDDKTTSGGTVKAGQTQKPEGTIGDYVVRIKKAEVVKSTYDGDDILVVTYSFTNNSKDAKAFRYAITDKAFQNGIETGSVYSRYGIEDAYDFDSKSREVQPGYFLDVQEAYELNDTTSDVTIEITEWISFKDEKLTYTIELDQLNQTNN